MEPSWQKLLVPFVGGIDTKSDEKGVLPTKLTVLENAEFIERGSVRKRRGYDAVPFETVDGSAIQGTPRGLFSYNDTAVMVTTRRAYSYSDRLSAWVDMGTYVPMGYRQEPVVQNNAQQSYGESAVASDVRVTVWEDSRGGVRMAVHDATTGAPLAADMLLASSNATCPRVVAIGGVLLVTYVDTSTDNIKYFRVLSWDVATSLAGSVDNLVTDQSTTNQAYDIVSVGERAVLVYDSDNAVVSGVRACLVTAGAAVSNYKQINSSNVLSNIAAIYDEENGVVAIAFEYGTNTIDVSTYAVSDLAPKNQNQLTDADFASTVRVALCKQPDGYVLWSDYAGTADSTRYVIRTPFDNSLSEGTQTTIRHAFIETNGFYYDGGFVVLGHDSRSGIQHGHYLYNHEGKLVGQLLVGQCPSASNARAHLPSVRPGAAASEFLSPLGFSRQVDVEGDDIAAYEHSGLMLTTFDGLAPVSAQQVGQTLYLSGSQLWAVAHGQPVEAGFTMFPDVLNADISHNGNASTNIASGDILSYRLYYEWRLPNGERMRSAAITRTFTATLAQDVKIVVPTLSHTLKDSQGNGLTDIALVGYRAEINKSTLFNRFTNPDPTQTGTNGFYSNDVTVDTVTVVDDMADSALTANEYDYLSKGEVRHFAPPAPLVLGNVGNRLLVGGGSLGNDTLAYSLLTQPGVPVEFSDFVDDTLTGRGPVKAIHSINGAPVIFKERSIYLLEGSGPDNTNRDGGYFLARKLTSDVGLTDPSAVVEIPQGLIFKSHKGFYLLDQSLNVSYIGADVEAYNSQTFTAATVIPDSNTVVFLASSGSTVVYDYFYGEWCVWTNHNGLAACVLNGDTYCYLRTDGKLYKRSAEYTDAGVSYAMRLRTAPIRPEHLQGFWKMRHFQVLGDHRSLHKLKVSLYYDRDNAPSETYTLDPSTFISTDSWGDDTTWGSGNYWGGALGGKEYQHGHRAQRSKCQTVRFEFEDIPGNNPGASYELTELAILYRDWGGLARLSTARKY